MDETKKTGRPLGSTSKPPSELIEENRLRSMRYALYILKTRLYKQRCDKDNITITNKDLMEIIRTLKELKSEGDITAKEANSITMLAKQLKASKKKI